MYDTVALKTRGRSPGGGRLRSVQISATMRTRYTPFKVSSRLQTPDVCHRRDKIVARIRRRSRRLAAQEFSTFASGTVPNPDVDPENQSQINIFPELPNRL